MKIANIIAMASWLSKAAAFSNSHPQVRLRLRLRQQYAFINGINGINGIQKLRMHQSTKTPPPRFTLRSTSSPVEKAFLENAKKRKEYKKSTKSSASTPLHLPSKSDFPSWAYDQRNFFRSDILHESTKSKARVGRIHTPHGVIDTPSFVAVATNAALKGVSFA